MDWYNRVEVIREKIKFQLTSRGIDTMAALEKYFQELDLDNSGQLDSDEFEKFLARIGIFLTKQELRAVYDVYDPNFDRLITFQEFLEPLKKDMGNARIDIVKQAFQVIDEMGKGYIPLEELLKKYNPAGHPRVRNRQKTPEEVYNDFEFAIKKKATGSGIVEFDGFMDYYQELNATLPIEKDAYFIDMVVRTWNLLQSGRYVTPEHISSLETIVYEKVRQRTSSKEDEGKVLLRAIKYIDIADSGAINFEQFSKLLVSVGCLLNEADTKILFWKFADEKSKKVCSEKFANYFALRGANENPSVKPKFKLEADLPKQVIAKMKLLWREQGGNGPRDLELLFRKIDQSGNKKVNRHEFTWALRENGHRLLPLDYERLFKYFDRNHDDVIDYEEFMKAATGDLHEKRKLIVYELFRKMDTSGQDKMSVERLISLYRPENHPKVISGEKTKKQVIDEFVKQWGNLKVVTLEEFEKYYTGLGTAIDREEQFENLLMRSWTIPEQLTKP